MDSFSKRLRTLRMEKGMKQSELAEALHFSQGMASAYENGCEPPFDVFMRIAINFDVSADYLLGLTSARKQDNGALIEETNHAAQQTESVGAPPIDSAGHSRIDDCHHSIRGCTLSCWHSTACCVA